jgi:excisionase family DNA binding protein
MADAPLESELLSVDEAARLLHLRPPTVRDWLLRRKISYVKLGRRVFLRRADIEALIASSVVPASRSLVKTEKVA